MTTIRDAARQAIGMAWTEEMVSAFADAVLAEIGIDPALPAESWHAFMERHGHELRGRDE